MRWPRAAQSRVCIHPSRSATGPTSMAGFGAARTLTSAPGARAVGPIKGPQQQLDELAVSSIVVVPDSGSRAAIGKNVLDPSARRGAAQAGHAQAAGVAEHARTIWS